MSKAGSTDYNKLELLFPENVYPNTDDQKMKLSTNNNIENDNYDEEDDDDEDDDDDDDEDDDDHSLRELSGDNVDKQKVKDEFSNNVSSKEQSEPQEIQLQPQSQVQQLQPPCDQNINLLLRPSMAFILENHNLEKLLSSLKRSLRIATCRIYSLQALNWLMRSVTQTACLHDLMWWFVTSLKPIDDIKSDYAVMLYYILIYKFLLQNINLYIFYLGASTRTSSFRNSIMWKNFSTVNTKFSFIFTNSSRFNIIITTRYCFTTNCNSMLWY